MGVYTLQETIFRNARRAGLSEIGEVDISVLRHEGWVRKLCEENACRNYSTNWACPPAVGTLEECRERCRSFDHMLLFNKVYTLRDSYDLEGMYIEGYGFNIMKLAEHAGIEYSHGYKTITLFGALFYCE